MINSKKAAIEAARRRWLLKHRDLFTPLLPPNSHYFAALEKETKNSTDKSTYKPLHEIEEQPELVKGGQLKDYQVSCPTRLSRARLTRGIAARALVACLDAQQRNELHFGRRVSQSFITSTGCSLHVQDGSREDSPNPVTSSIREGARQWYGLSCSLVDNRSNNNRTC